MVGCAVKITPLGQTEVPALYAAPTPVRFTFPAAQGWGGGHGKLLFAFSLYSNINLELVRK